MTESSKSKDEALVNAARSAIKNKLGELMPVKPKVAGLITETKKIISEAIYTMSKPFVLKTEKLSQFTKDNHFKLYQNYVDSLNRISPRIDTIDKNIDSLNPNDSEFRRLKLNEMHNANGVKLHELYFSNISDLTSSLRADNIPYIKLSRDFGTFEQWQFDFRACGMVALEGWAVCYYDPHCKKYQNCFIEGHTLNLPIGGIPVIVLDTWHHAWFKDYGADKKGYLNAMMLELNWSVIEQRMVVAERSNIDQVFAVQPVMSSAPGSFITSEPVNSVPISVGGTTAMSNISPVVAPTASPMMETASVKKK
jgi:superoxide dismutase, Fe-Mn family